MSFLKKHGVNIDQVQIERSNEYSSESSDAYDYKSSTSMDTTAKVSTDPAPSLPQSDPHPEAEPESLQPLTKPKSNYSRTLSGGLQSSRADVPKEAILQRINSKKEGKSYQLGHQLQRKWSTGAGPRIDCIVDYPWSSGPRLWSTPSCRLGSLPRPRPSGELLGSVLPWGALEIATRLLWGLTHLTYDVQLQL